MAYNWFYLHFRHEPAPKTLDMLRENGADMQQVFETSYNVAIDMSGASLRRLLKFNAPQDECYIVTVKKAHQFAPADD